MTWYFISKRWIVKQLEFDFDGLVNTSVMYELGIREWFPCSYFLDGTKYNLLPLPNHSIVLEDCFCWTHFLGVPLVPPTPQSIVCCGSVGDNSTLHLDGAWLMLLGVLEFLDLFVIVSRRSTSFFGVITTNFHSRGVSLDILTFYRLYIAWCYFPHAWCLYLYGWRGVSLSITPPLVYPHIQKPLSPSLLSLNNINRDKKL